MSLIYFETICRDNPRNAQRCYYNKQWADLHTSQHATRSIVPSHFINTDYLSTGVINHRIILQINPSYVNYYGASHLSLQLLRETRKFRYRVKHPKTERLNFHWSNWISHVMLINRCFSINDFALLCVAVINHRLKRDNI